MGEKGLDRWLREKKSSPGEVPKNRFTFPSSEKGGGKAGRPLVHRKKKGRKKNSKEG